MKDSQRKTGAPLSIAIAIGLSLLSTGCTSTRFHSASQEANLPAEVRVGDQINCHLKDGTQKAFSVTAVEPAALVGQNVRVPVADISALEVTRFDGKKTILKTGKVVGTVLLGTVALVGLGAMALTLH